MTTLEILICLVVMSTGVLFALVIDHYERKVERARYELRRQSRAELPVVISIDSRKVWGDR